MNDLTLEEAKEKVRENEDSITSLIDPSDLVYQDIDSWENVDIDKLEEELAIMLGEAWTYGIDHPYGDMIRDLAVKDYIDHMDRVPFDHLVFDSREKCVIEGYWLYDMSYDEVFEIVWKNRNDIDHFYDFEQPNMMEIENAIIEARLEDLK